MGAYGSPELRPPDKESGYYTYGTDYGQYNISPPKHNKHNGLTFFLGVAVGALLFSLISYLTGANTLKKDSVSVLASVPASISSTSIIVNDSDDYLRSWAKAVILKNLLYPDTAKFSSRSPDWEIIRNGSQCEISSVVTARGKSKTMGTTTFVVRLYYDDLKAHVIYIKIGNDVVYDASSSTAKQ